MKFSRSCFLVILILIFVFCMVTNVSAAYEIVKNDPDNPTKYSIDTDIAKGFSTNDIYIGTVEAYLGDNADGKTPVFDSGMGVHPADILIMNNKVGIVLAIGTADPWGYPGGSILDAGRVYFDDPANVTDWQSADFGKDTVLTVQFLFNSWDAWAPVNCGMVYCDLVKYNFKTKEIDNTNGVPAVQINRKFTVPNGTIQRDFDVITYYSIDPGADYAYMYDTIHNKGPADVTAARTNQLCISNKGGDGIDTKTVAALTAANTYNWVADENGDPTREFSTTLICPGQNLGSDGRTHPFGSFGGATGYREFNFYTRTYTGQQSKINELDYKVGESRLYESYLMIDDKCSWQKVYDFYAKYNNLDTFNISGTVTDESGKPVPYASVLVYRYDANNKDGNGNPDPKDILHGWVMADKDGKYSVDLPNEKNPEQTYNLRVEATDRAVGKPCDNFTSAKDGETIDLKAGAKKVAVTFNFVDADTNEPVWGRVIVGGNAPITAFTGKTYYFSDNSSKGELEKDGYGPGTKEVVKGQVTAMVAPDENYSARCYGEGYYHSSYTGSSTTAAYQTVTGDPSTDTSQEILVTRSHPTPEDWFGIDNHHHGQRMDAFSEPEVVAKAQITSGLEVLTLDDHEFSLDNWPVYQWSQKMNAVGYMPSEEVTASWAHFDIMPLSADCYEQWLDRNQENKVVNTNQSLRGIIDEGHLYGASIGAMHPTSSYGMLLADTNKTVPGGLIDDFDGLETQCSTAHMNEAIQYWDAYVKGGSHRNVPVERPHYIWASTDIHQSGSGTNSGNFRSYVFVENGSEKSAEDYDAFGLEFARSQALGHSFNSSGVFIIPATKGLMYGNTYSTDANGDFTAKFDISAINDITEVYVFSSLSNTPAAAGGFANFRNCLSHTTYSGADLTNDLKDFRVELKDIRGKQWIALAASSSNGRYAFTNPIWINGANVKQETITEVSFQYPPTLPEALTHGETIEAPTSAGVLTTVPWSERMVADWTIEGAEFGDTAVGGATYTYKLTYKALDGYVFSQDLNNKDKGFAVSADGTTLVYSQQITVGGFKITTQVIGDGAITPGESEIYVKTGDDQTFTFTPGDGKQINSVVVDGVNVGKVNTYTFKDVQANHTLKVTFSAKPALIITDAEVTVDENGMGILNPSNEQWDAKLKQGKDGIIFDFRNNDALANMTGITITAPLDKLDGTDIQFILPDNAALTVPADAWQAIQDAAGDTPVNLIITSKDGKVTVGLKQGDLDIARIDGMIPLEIEIPYTAAANADANYVVAKKLGDDGTVIPRSWYDESSKIVYAKIFKFGEYEPIYIPAVSFNDTMGLWMDTAVKYLRIRDVAQGIGNNQYAPERPITRAEYTALLMRTFDLRVADGYKGAFKDTDIPDYAKDYIDIAASHAFILGDGNGYFLPNDNITRQDMFILTYRVMLAMDMLPATIPNTPVTFKDFDQTASYAKDAVEVLAKLKLVNGDTNGYLNPTANTSRAESAQFFYNILSQDR